MYLKDLERCKEKMAYHTCHKIIFEIQLMRQKTCMKIITKKNLFQLCWKDYLPSTVNLSLPPVSKC